MAPPREPPLPPTDAGHPSDTGRATDVGSGYGKQPAKAKPKKPGGGYNAGAIPPPPVTTKGPPSAAAALKQMMEKYPNFKKWQPQISAAAKLYGADPIQLYSVLVALGSHGDAAYQDSSGGVGLANITFPRVEKWMNPSQYTEFVRKWGNQAGNSAADPNFAINFLAWSLAGSGQNYRSINAWLAGGQRTNIPSKYGRSPYQVIPPQGRTPDEIRVAGTPDYQIKEPPTPPDKAATQVTAATAKKDLTDPYVAGVTGGKKGGKLVTTGDPNKAMEYYGGKVRVSDFLQLQALKTKYFNDYTGQNPTYLQIGNLIRHQWGEYTLINILAKGPHFKSSPIYQRDSLAFEDAGKDLVPKGTKIPEDLMRKAIVNGWSVGAFQESLRQHGFYEQSNEYQNNFGVLRSSYQNIMGTPDTDGVNVVKRAVKLGWTQPIFESWLRKSPAYKYSPEYQAKVVGFLDSMGMFIGARAQLSELSVKQMMNVPTTVSEGGKNMQVNPTLDTMPSGKNPMLKATFPYTKTPTPPTTAGRVADRYVPPPLQKKPKPKPVIVAQPTAKPYQGHVGP